MGKINRIVARQNQRTELAYYKHLFSEVKPFIQARQMLDDSYNKGAKDGALKERKNIVDELTLLRDASVISLAVFEQIVRHPIVDTTPTKEVVNAG